MRLATSSSGDSERLGEAEGPRLALSENDPAGAGGIGLITRIPGSADVPVIPLSDRNGDPDVARAFETGAGDAGTRETSPPPASSTLPSMCTWLVRLAAVALVLGLLLSLTPERASACICREFPSSEEMLALSDTVFAGRVVDMSDEAGSYDSAVGYYRVVQFRVSRVWKGEPFSTIFLVDPATSCTANFRAGHQYLVYASRITDLSSSLTGSLKTDACSRPTSLQNAQADIDVLGEGRLPEPGKVTSVPGEATFPYVGRRTIVLLAGTIVLAGLGLWYVR